MKLAEAVHSLGLEERARLGIENLLDRCMQVKPGEDVLVVRDYGGFFKSEVVDYFEQFARARGIQVHSLTTAGIDGPEKLPKLLVKSIQSVKHTIFFHTLGGMLRFVRISNAGTVTNSFATSLEDLASPFCTTDYRLVQALAKKLQGELNAAKQWRITCPLGTDLSSEVTAIGEAGVSGDGFTMRQFPIGTNRPFPTDRMDGRLAIRWLIGSGVHRLSPFGIKLDEPVLIDVQAGRMVGFSGTNKDVTRVRERYDQIAGSLGYGDEALRISSWHAGTNPQGFCATRDTDDFERWLVLAHHNPRMVHFHSVGDFNPGEVTLPVIDPTIFIDGEDYWREGKLRFLEREDVRGLAATYPAGESALIQRTDIGLS